MKRRILFVDDETSVLDGIRRMLHREEDVWETGFAQSGKMALNKLALQQFDVVFTDLRMPFMDGIELLRKINDTHPGIPVVMLTGHGDLDSAIEAMQLGAVNYLQKPIESELLKQSIRSALERVQP